MSRIAGRSIELEKALCDLFDIDASKTHKVSIIVEAGDIAKVVVEHHLMQNEIKGLITLLSEHRESFQVDTVKTMRSRRPSNGS